MTTTTTLHESTVTENDPSLANTSFELIDAVELRTRLPRF